jgi:uncharacterized protein YjbJ (UPF0337 family)
MKKNLSNRVKGKAEEIAGTAQKTLGHVIGDHDMEAHGVAHEVSGKARQETAKLAEAVEAKVATAVGAAKAGVGEAVGDRRLYLNGKVEELEGKARTALNK